MPNNESTTSSTTNFLSSNDTEYENRNNSIVGFQTPVLFSTDHGIYLRVISNSSTSKTTATTTTINNISSNLTNSSSSSSSSSKLYLNALNSKYRVQLCDLERWQQCASKVNTIGLSPDAPIMNLGTKSKHMRHKSVRFVAEAEQRPPTAQQSLQNISSAIFKI